MGAVSRKTYMMLLAGSGFLLLLIVMPLVSGPGSPVSGPLLRTNREQPADGAAPPAERRRLHIAVAMSEQEFARLKAFNREMEARYPELSIFETNIDSADAYRTWKQEAQIGDSPDIMLLDNAWVREFAVRGYLLPADSAYTGETLSDQLKGMLEPLQWNGYYWGVPKDADPLLAVWNGELLRSAGSEKPPGSIEEALRLAAAAADREPDVRLVRLAAEDGLGLAVWLDSLEASGGSAVRRHVPTDKEAGMLRLLGTAAAPLMIGADGGAEKVKQLFRTGRLLSALLPQSEYAGLGAADRKLVVRSEIDRHAVWTGGRSFVISAAAEAPDEASRWIAEFTSANRQWEDYREFGKLPARKSLYSGTLSAYSSVADGAAWLAAFDRPEAYPADPEWTSRMTAWSETWAAAVRAGAEEGRRFLEEWERRMAVIDRH